jgi:glycerol-3-phosphate acyltransferase PlsY
MGGAALLLTYVVTRKFLPSWIATLVALPLIAYFLGNPMPVVVSLLVSAVIILIAHKNNIMQVWFTSEHKA